MNFADFFAGLHGSMEHRLPPPPTEDEVAELYGALGLNPGASANEIRKAYLKLARTKHPDRGGDPTEFHAIQEGASLAPGGAASATLSDARRVPRPPGRVRRCGVAGRACHARALAAPPVPPQPSTSSATTTSARCSCAAATRAWRPG